MRISGTLAFLSLLTLLSYCGRGGGFFSHSEKASKLISIKVKVEQEESSESSLMLAPSVASSLYLRIDTCSSSYTFGPALISSSVVNLFGLDKNCLVKLTQFDFNSKTYSATATGATNFTTWSVNSVATFANTTNSSDTIKVFVKSQVSTTLNASDVVAYTFTDVQAGSSTSLSAANVKTGVPLTVQGQDAPNYTVISARFVQANADGSATLAFTLDCGIDVTGSAGAYNCITSPSSVPVPQSQFDYIFIPDTYSQGVLTVAQARAAFAANSATSVTGANQIGVGGSDGAGNTVTHGGFITGSLVTGSTPISPSNLNYVLMVRRKDSSGNDTSYLYFYVVITPYWTTTTNCSTTFAGGAGTQDDPYQVGTRAALEAVGTSPCNSNSVYFSQVANIDLGGSGSPWTAPTLTGQYDGGGFTISNLFQSSSATTTKGLFASIAAGASVRNLVVSSADVRTDQNDAGVLATSSRGNITNVSVSGVLETGIFTSSKTIGGLIGTVTAGTIRQCSSSVTITSGFTGLTSQAHIGALIGAIGGGNGNTTITNSYATGSIGVISVAGSGASAYLNLGSLIGYALGDATNTVTVTDSYATGNVTVTTASGIVGTRFGLIGELTGIPMSISGLFATGTYAVNGGAPTCQMGGLVGDINTTGSPTNISNSYTMATLNCGSTTAGTGVAGFVGTVVTGTNISNSYSAAPSVSYASGTPSGFAGSGTGSLTLSSVYMYDNAGTPAQTITGLTSYTTQGNMEDTRNYTGFDFGNSIIWAKPSANPLSPSSGGTVLSPVLKWQCGTNGIVCFDQRLSILNGNFEQGTLDNVATFVTLAAGNTAISAWTISVADVDWTYTLWTPSSGVRSLDVSGNSGGVISQVFTTVVGAKYAVFFDMAGNPAGAPTVKNLRVSAASDTTDYTFDTTGKSYTNMSWTTKIFTFTATSTSTTLTFTSLDASVYGPALDSVR